MPRGIRARRRSRARLGECRTSDDGCPDESDEDDQLAAHVPGLADALRLRGLVESERAADLELEPALGGELRDDARRLVAPALLLGGERHGAAAGVGMDA